MVNITLNVVDEVRKNRKVRKMVDILDLCEEIGPKMGVSAVQVFAAISKKTVGKNRTANYRAHHKWIHRIGDSFMDMEHFRLPNKNVSVVVLIDGRCFVGRSNCSDKDVYNPHMGYRIAFGRALKRAASYGVEADFVVEKSLQGRDLRAQVRKELKGEVPLFSKWSGD